MKGGECWEREGEEGEDEGVGRRVMKNERSGSDGRYVNKTINIIVHNI